MNKILYITILSLFVISCKNEPEDKYVVDGKAEGVFNGMRVYLSKVDERGAPIPKDTAIVMNEKFSFNGKVDYPQMYYVTLNGTGGRFPIVLENGNSSLILDKNIINNSSFKGSDSYDIFNEYSTKLSSYFKDIGILRENLNQSRFLKDSVAIAKDQELLTKLNEELIEYPYTFMSNHTDSYAILPILNTQINAKGVDFDRVVNIYESLNDELKSTEEAKRIKANLDKMKIVLEAEKKTAIGEIAPKFSAPNPKGEPIALNDVISKGKITIIDFWAAWCGPCRRENPNVVKIYEKYHDKGLEIIGVSLDGRRGQQNPKEAWIKAIEKDGLTWHQVSNLRYFDEIAKLYNVRAIPAMFVLDSEGKIIAKNLRGLALENKIAELLQ